jgi:predicted DNA repair protein MutK
MASGFFALFDDIAYLLDDVATTTKVATQKTAGILGDDLAVNAKKASGFASSRELPVLWAITKGSFLNKLIILPLIFLLNYFLPSLIPWLLMIGGVYLAYEGFEKVYEYFFHKGSHDKVKEKLSEKEKIRSAITTDFILSLEIVIIALGTVMREPLLTQILSVTFVALIATIGVYGLVALIVRMDDFGVALIKKGGELNEKIGRFLVSALPKVIKALSVIGVVAMFLVAGGIFMHNVEYLHHLFDSFPSILGELIVGVLVGAISLFPLNFLKEKLIK